MSTVSNQRKPAAIPQSGVEARQAIRGGEWTGPTAGLAPGYVQGNLAILPNELASDFMRFCQLNPKPCPLLAVSRTRRLAAAVAGRRPRHPHRRAALPRVRSDGELIDEPRDIARPLARRPGERSRSAARSPSRRR